MNHIDNFILIPDFISEQFCQEIIDYCSSLEFKKAHQFYNGRNNNEIFIDNHSLIYCSQNFKDSILKHRINLIEWSFPIEIYKYEQNDHITPHYDSEELFPSGKSSNYTAILYLNDDFMGGATFFPEINVLVQPKKGSLLVFKHHILHEAQSVQSGCKMILRSNWFIQ